MGGTTVDFSYFFGGLRKTKTSGGVTKNYYYDGDRLIAEKWSTGAYLLYHYDETGSPYAITYSATGGGYAKYYLIKNLQGDVLQIRNVNNAVVANYEYDAWGRVVSVKYANGNDINVSNHIGVINPIRYRGYYYDSETGFYYLKSRYYDPAICRFISADDPSYLGAGETTQGLNLFAYCGNNPVARIDRSGHFWDTVFDIISLGASIVEVCVNPTDPWAWAGLVGDAIDLVPFVTGIGEVTRAAKAVDKVTDTVQIAKAVDLSEDAVDIVKTLDRSSGFTKSTASAGRKIHKGYKTGAGFNPKFKEARKITGVRPDYIDLDKKIIYELKPMNRRGVRSGIRQLLKYNEAYGGGFKLVLDLY